MSAADLVVGRPYFTVTSDPRTGTPIITSFTFLGRDPAGVPYDDAGPRYYFRLLPPLQEIQPGEEDRASAEAWGRIFPGGFEGWGESWPTPLGEDALTGLFTLEGLVAELGAGTVPGPRRR